MYSLVGVNSNAYSILGYVNRALKETGNKELINKYMERAQAGSYDDLLCVSLEYLDICNLGLKEDAEDYEEDDWSEGY